MRVGRAPLDEDAIRLIEQHNPEVEFDWTRILKGQGNEPAPRVKTDVALANSQLPTPNSKGAKEAPTGPLERPREAVQLEAVGPQIDEPVTAAGKKLGAEGLARLRGRYAEMLARITERVPDPERQAELKATAERLNPDAWVTDAEVLAGLDAYEATFESLRGVVGHRRRRNRRPHPPSGSRE